MTPGRRSGKGSRVSVSSKPAASGALPLARSAGKTAAGRVDAALSIPEPPVFDPASAPLPVPAPVEIDAAPKGGRALLAKRPAVSKPPARSVAPSLEAAAPPPPAASPKPPAKTPAPSPIPASMVADPPEPIASESAPAGSPSTDEWPGGWPGLWSGSPFQVTQTVYAQASQRLQESATETASTLLELQGKFWGLAQAQREAGLSMLGSMLATRSLSDAIEVQARHAGEAIDATTTRWQDIAQTAARFVDQMAKKPDREK